MFGKKFVIEDYNTSWPEKFKLIKSFLVNTISLQVLQIEHVGSTAIVGLCAKPIIDIDIIIDNDNSFNLIDKALQKVGYFAKGNQGILGRYVYKQQLNTITGKLPSHHLYVCYADSLALKNHLLFRNALLNDNELMQKYASLKKNLVLEKGMTRENYNKLKTVFVLNILANLGFTNDELEAIQEANE